MSSKKIAAFSLLAHINDNNIGIKSFQDIFIPIIKTALCKLSNDGIKSGKSISEIKDVVDQTFVLDIPIPILKNLLMQIASEKQNDIEGQFVLHKDNSFQLNKYLVADYEEELEERENEVAEVERIYKAYLTSAGIDPNSQPSIFEYIDQNRISLSKFFAYKYNKDVEIEYIHQANFINSIKDNKKIYNILRRVYLGSIISAYLEVEIGEATNKIELLLDTNFVIGLLDLNSQEATHTCRKISEICDKLGFSKSILPFTLEETESLIDRKAMQLENAFFQGYLDPESIYNAAKRRGLSKTQLQKIAKNLQSTLQNDFKVYAVGNDQKFRNLAKFQYNSIYEFYKGLRGDHGYSALHDTTAIAYVKEKRGGKPIKGDLLKANCWFVTNTPFSLALPEKNDYLPEIIRAEDILNFLWLSNPNVTGFINSSELSNLGLTRLVSTTVSYSLPNPRVLRDLDENFNTYGGKEITADDTIMVAAMISRKKIDRPDELNRIALQNPNDFISKVKVLADQGRKEEKETQEKLDKIFKGLEAILRKHENKKDEKSDSLPIETKPDLEIDMLRKQNNRMKNILIFIVLLLISVIWWVLDFIIEISFFSEQRNYILIKLMGQAFFITACLAIFNKGYRGSWITGSIAIALSFCVVTKKENNLSVGRKSKEGIDTLTVQTKN